MCCVTADVLTRLWPMPAVRHRPQWERTTPHPSSPVGGEDAAGVEAAPWEEGTTAILDSGAECQLGQRVNREEDNNRGESVLLIVKYMIFLVSGINYCDSNACIFSVLDP